MVKEKATHGFQSTQDLVQSIPTGFLSKMNGILLLLLAIPLAMYIYIFYAQLLSILMIQKALDDKGKCELSKKKQSNLKKVYISNVMVLIIEGTSILTLGSIFMFFLVTFFMSLSL